MTSNAIFVAQWWRYKTQHLYPVPSVEVQWLEYGQIQPLNSTDLDSTAVTNN